ncbi:Uncharacterised protein [Leclercia adecarboxylata]|uniref:Uncharacterized protein n=1 Tax=Leclercia adecarboxylata TaxID=83655 RepID=A0A4U9IQ31_9ENTR|nr:Uncharacterised protein [Leclercia adecarboxylata]
MHIPAVVFAHFYRVLEKLRKTAHTANVGNPNPE